VLGEISLSKLGDRQKKVNMSSGERAQVICTGKQHLLGSGAQVVQAGPDVLAVVVSLFLIECGLSTQALECGLQLHQLCLPPLTVPALVSDVLEFRKRREELCWPFLVK
jgi:hypothetical protein